MVLGASASDPKEQTDCGNHLWWCRSCRAFEGIVFALRPAEVTVRVCESGKGKRRRSARQRTGHSFRNRPRRGVGQRRWTMWHPHLFPRIARTCRPLREVRDHRPSKPFRTSTPRARFIGRTEIDALAQDMEDQRRAVETHTVKAVLFVMEAVALKSKTDEEQAEKMAR